MWPCGRAVTLSRHPNLVGVLANSSFPFIFSLLHLFFFSLFFFPPYYLLPTAPPPPTCFARFCWTTSSGNQRYDHSDNLFLQQKSLKTQSFSYLKILITLPPSYIHHVFVALWGHSIFYLQPRLPQTARFLALNVSSVPFEN